LDIKELLDNSLARFKLKRLLGEGADLQVFSAVDLETGLEVVVKRPHPSLISRDSHRGVEYKLKRMLTLRCKFWGMIPHSNKILSWGVVDENDPYFGDNHSIDYLFVVEERALGIPLVASVVDAIKGHPIGLPQNLFALHPLRLSRKVKSFALPWALLDLQQALITSGAILLDLRPQNIFIEPISGLITVIDMSNIYDVLDATGRSKLVDLHDFYLEIFKWYIPLGIPPSTVAEYYVPYGMDSVVRFESNLRDLINGYSSADKSSINCAAAQMLERVLNRNYRDIAEFSKEFRVLTDNLAEAYEQFATSKASEVWAAAAQSLLDPYWSQYQFESKQFANEFDLIIPN